MRDISSWELVKEFQIGWNLGNSLDAVSKNNFAGLKHEIAWGNPYTSKKMIDFVIHAGFQVIRYPITWYPHFLDTDSYMIDPAWMARVKELVDYTYHQKVYVILNIHHENWHYPCVDNYEKASHILHCVWKQIADFFKDYDEHLIFEGLNEPRLINHPTEWIGGTKEARSILNKLNAVFVQTIRQSTGNNPKRHLMIPTHGASVKKEAVEELIVPDDKIIVSTHAYVPTDFAIVKDGIAIFDLNQPHCTQPIDSCFALLKETFIDKKIPVIMGEFGSVNRDNLSDRLIHLHYYLETAKKTGIPCIWWDNGYLSGEGELFGLLNRQTIQWAFPEIVDVLIKYKR